MGAPVRPAPAYPAVRGAPPRRRKPTAPPSLPLPAAARGPDRAAAA